MTKDEGFYRRRDDAMSDEEFLARYERQHGRKAMEAIARVLAMDPPPYRKRPPFRAGTKEQPRKGLGKNAVPPQGPSLRDMVEAAKTGDVPPERARITEAKRAGTCKAKGCGGRFAKGDEVVMLEPSHRLVHGRCAPAAARERCAPRETTVALTDDAGGAHGRQKGT